MYNQWDLECRQQLVYSVDFCMLIESIVKELIRVFLDLKYSNV